MNSPFENRIKRFMLRRLANLLTALLLCGATLVPTATASIVGMGSHACCIHHHAAAQSHCVGMKESVVPEIGSAGKMECAYCCPGLTAPASSQARPAAGVISPAPVDAHPFLNEFLPQESSDADQAQDSQRAPPVVSSR